MGIVFEWKKVISHAFFDGESWRFDSSENFWVKIETWGNLITVVLKNIVGFLPGFDIYSSVWAKILQGFATVRCVVRINFFCHIWRVTNGLELLVAN